MCGRFITYIYHEHQLDVGKYMVKWPYLQEPHQPIEKVLDLHKVILLIFHHGR